MNDIPVLFLPEVVFDQVILAYPYIHYANEELAMAGLRHLLLVNLHQPSLIVASELALPGGYGDAWQLCGLAEVQQQMAELRVA